MAITNQVVKFINISQKNPKILMIRLIILPNMNLVNKLEKIPIKNLKEIKDTVHF